MRTDPPGRDAALRSEAVLQFGAPALTFAVLAMVFPVRIAAAAAVGATLVVIAVGMRRGRPVRLAFLALAVTVLCTLVATASGAARDFFLLPMFIPPAVLILCLVSLAKGRPLMGSAINSVVGGPGDWPHHARLCHVYRNATWLCVAIGVLNGTAQAVFYVRNVPAALAIIHMASGPVFGTVTGLVMVRARQVIHPPDG